jgi:spore germination protein
MHGKLGFSLPSGLVFRQHAEMTTQRLHQVILTLVSILTLIPSFALAKPTYKAWVYQAWWLPESWRTAPLDRIDRVLFFEIKVNPNGTISEKNGWPEKWGDLSLALKKTNTPLDLTLTLLNTKDFQAVFSSEQSTNNLIEHASNLASDKNVSGLHLDFEVYTDVPEIVRARFQRFVIELAKKLRSVIPAKNLSVFLPIGATTSIYTYQALTQVNQVVAQGYDAHWAGGPNAGPIAPLDGPVQVTWKKAIEQSLALGVKSEKLLMSYPFYGYEWKTSDKSPNGKSIADAVTTTLASTDASRMPDVRINVHDRLKTAKANNDLLSGSSYYQLRKDGQWTTGWYEGQWAMSRKVQFMRNQKFAGMAFFVLGYDDGKLLELYLSSNAIQTKRNK